MDQPTYEDLLRDFQQHCSSEHGLPDLAVFAGRPAAPLVVLIHGIGGNAQHWSDPVGLDPNDTWLFDLTALPPPSTDGLGSSPPYRAGSVTPWCEVLAGAQLSYVNWSQARPADLLQYAVQEAVAVLSALEQRVFAPYAQDVAVNGGQVPPLVVLCHSRGGLVARAALKQLGSAGAPHLRQVITLNTPHDGSFMPRLADDYARSLDGVDFSALAPSLPAPIRFLLAVRIDQLLAQLALQVRLALLHSFGAPAQGAGFDELAPESAMLQALAQDEAPLTGVRYSSFGGSQPTFITYYFCEAGRSFPLLPVASAFLVEQLALLPDVASRYGGLAELQQGDSAVALSSSRWPAAFGAAHQVFPLNHMQALIDPALQQAVLAIVQA